MPESRSHAPFAIFNRTVNPVVRGLLRSPAHRLLGRSLVLITVTGRRSGRDFTIPTGYERTPNGIRIGIGWPERKLWWRNLTGAGAPVRVLIDGTEFMGTAVAEGDEQSGVAVKVSLDGWSQA